MNILPKKSWHVLSRDNVKKVRKDEEEAREKEKEFARKTALAEQELRIEFMRKRSKGGELDRESKRTKVEEVPADNTPQHINFFSDLQTGIGLEGAVNKEHEKEKKAEQEKWEKKVGLLNYLVDKDSSSSDPWYLKKPASKKSFEKRSIADPLVDMKVHLEGKKKSAATDSAPTPPPKSKAVSTNSTAIQPVDDTKESKRHKKKKKESEREDKEMMLKKMREDRMRREAEEQSRAEKLMKRHYGVDDEPTPKPIEEIPGRYNSQYNPHLVRKK